MPDTRGDWFRLDRIDCPRCRVVQNAVVTWKNGDPFPTFIHTCVGCQYVIMESEWNVVPPATACAACGLPWPNHSEGCRMKTPPLAHSEEAT